jgi:serine/threonine-protein kinase RsbW
MNSKSNTVRFQLPARLDALAILEIKVQEVMEGLPDSDEIRTAQYNFTLALHELCANIVNHAYGEQGGEIEIVLTMELAPQQLQAVIIDSGKPFDRTAVSAPNFDAPQEHGYGIFLIEALVDEVAYYRLDTGNKWMLTLSLSSKIQR